MSEMKRLILIDPGFVAMRGHHYSTSITIGTECAKRNIEYLIFSSKNLAREQAAKGKIPKIETSRWFPVLTDVLYADRGYTIDDMLEFFLLYSDIFAAELENYVTPHLDSESRILCHTANAIVIYAIYKWLIRCSVNIQSIVLNVQLSFNDSNVDFIQYSAALSKISAYKSVKIYGGNIQLCRLLAAALHCPVRILPLPLHLPHIVKQSDDPIPVFCVAGEARDEKNLQIIPDAVHRYYSGGGRGCFKIQLQSVPRNQFNLLQHRLAQLRDKFPDNIDLRIGPLYGEAFYRHIACSDAVLLTYPAHAYRNRVSQIALEAASLGVSCIATRYSSMEEELARLDNGSVFMEQSDPEELARAMLDFEHNLEENRAKAAAAGKIFRAFHNINTYFAVAADDGTVHYPDYACLEPPAEKHLPHNPQGDY
jgi:glycosyltransferase involved in cell wall biosynthesis